MLNELQLYNPELLDKPRMLAVTKMDLIDEEMKEWLTPTLPAGIPTVFISAVTEKGIDELKDTIWSLLNTNNYQSDEEE